jgi:heme A synthase
MPWTTMLTSMSHPDPLHIHLIQLAAATLLTLVQLRWQPSQPSNDEAPRPSMLGWVFLVLLTSLMAGAAVLNLQAILHCK